MNKNRLILTSGLVLVLSLLSIAAVPAARHNQADFSAVSVCDPFKVEPKEVANGLRYTGQEQVCSFTASDPQLSGTATYKVYGTLNPKANMAGKLSGFVTILNAGGKWEGLWKAKIDNKGNLYIHIKLVGGNGYYGLQAVSKGQRLAGSSITTFEGYTYEATKPVIILPPQ